MSAHEPDRTADFPAGGPSEMSAGTADRSRNDTSADPDRTGHYVPGSAPDPIDTPEPNSDFPSVPGYQIESVLGRGA